MMDDQQQLIFAPKLHRVTDPDTSRAAGEKQQSRLTAGMALVLDVHEEHPEGLTDDEARARLTEKGRTMPHGSVSKRRGDLVALGIIVATTERRETSSGSPAIVWRLVPEQHRASA